MKVDELFEQTEMKQIIIPWTLMSGAGDEFTEFINDDSPGMLFQVKILKPSADHSYIRVSSSKRVIEAIELIIWRRADKYIRDSQRIYEANSHRKAFEFGDSNLADKFEFVMLPVKLDNSMKNKTPEIDKLLEKQLRNYGTVCEYSGERLFFNCFDNTTALQCARH